MQQQHTILVVDDDRIELGIMNNVLSTAGYRVLIAEDGETGFNRAIFAQPSLILLDVMMPGIDGFETCRRLRENKRTRGIPIFFKTCRSDDRALIDSYREGIDDYFVKPSNHHRLLHQIKSRLSSDRSFYLKTRIPPLS